MALTARPTPSGRMSKWAPGISAPFGYSLGYRGGKYPHHGQDYFWLTASSAGSSAASAASFRVLAAGAGTVTKIVWTFELGMCITINHGSFDTRSCHMPNNSAAVTVGQSVTDQTYLGPMGNAGTDAFGEYHLHFEVWQNGVRVDPEPYFAIAGTAGSTGTPIVETSYQEEEDDMMLIAINDGLAKYGPKNAWLYALVTPTGTLDLDPTNYDAFTAPLAFSYGERDKAGAPTGRAFNLTYAQWDWFHRPVSVGSVDLAPVVSAVTANGAAIKGVSDQIGAFTPAPAPSVIAKAVNDDAAARLAQ